MKITSSLLLLLVCANLISCKPKEQSHKDARSAWNTATTIDAYEKHGSKNAKWDKDAKKCLEKYVKIRSGLTNYEERTLTFQMIGTYASSAVNNGCDDPLIEYLYCRFGQGVREEQRKTQLCKTADKMQSSSYAPIRKFFTNLRAAESLWKGRDTNVWNQVAQYERAAVDNFIEMANDKSTPIEEIDETAHDLLEMVSMQDWALKMIIDGAEAPLVKNWPDEDATYALKGSLYFQYAWSGRGGGYANKVTDNSWKLFGERLAIATAAAEKAWGMNPKNTRIPVLMVKLAEANQKPRPEMELWFTRAMELEPNNNEACNCKLHYLYPQWYGSTEEMLKFGRECVASDKWTGSVPLTLVDAHEQISIYERDPAKRKEYWKQDFVWNDIHSAFEKFFEKNPDGYGYHHNYAKYAYACEQWECLDQQLKLLGDVNYSYFGGEQKFNKMVQLAKQHTETGSTGETKAP